MWFIFPFLLILGLFLPGFFIAKYLRHSLWWASAFPISLLVLFHSVFWLGILHIPITLGTVLPCLIAVTVLAALAQRGSAIPAKATPAPPFDLQDRILLVSSGIVGAVLAARLAITPLIGFDARFRWDFLAQRILALGRFDFYPPLTPSDFRTYFYVDGIPPLVSFTHWWLYASAGKYLPSLICLFVAAQFACTLAFTYGAASALFSRRAGVLAAAVLAGCPLYFRSVVLGQETGLTALAIAATTYFIVTSRQPDDVPAMVSAGLAAALCALSREYGWIALIAGLIALGWRRQPLKQAFAFAAVAIAVAAPWYARNWILTGNPFYSLQFGSFAVNPIHAAILQHYNALLGWRQWASGTWPAVWWFFLTFAMFQVLAGIPGARTDFRRRGYLPVMALLLSLVWIESVGYTAGGMAYSIRVLSPALVVLSITAAGMLTPLTQRAGWHTTLTAAIILCQILAEAHGVFYPRNYLFLPPSPWRQHVFQSVPAETEFQVRDQVASIVPAKARILCDSPYLHAALIDKGIEVVPIWSPEVRFLFSLPPEETERRLRSLNIRSVVYNPISLNAGYLASASPFYASLPQRWRVQAQFPGGLEVLAQP